MSNRIFTYTGQFIDPMDPDPWAFRLEDIAHSLSLQCRYTGHCKTFYSVAQHAALCALWATEDGYPKDVCASVLMHDAAEAYLCDIPRPLKHLPGFGDVYKEAEDRLQSRIFQHYDIPNGETTWKVIKDYDVIALVTEQRDIMCEKASEGGSWFPEYVPRAEILDPWPWQTAKQIFLTAASFVGVGDYSRV